MQEPLKALTQSYTRTKAKNYKAFRETMELHTNSSNNTIFADADGNIAYFHANFIPRRDTQLRLDEAGGRQRSGHRVEGRAVGRRDAEPAESRPAAGSTTPTTGRGRRRARAARRRRTFRRTWRAATRTRAACTPSACSANAEGLHARLADRARRYDSYLPEFELLIPPLVKAWDEAPASDPLKAKLAEQIDAAARVGLPLGRGVGADVARRLLGRRAVPARVGRRAQGRRCRRTTYVGTKAPAGAALQALAAASDKLAADFGTWKTPWGDINRFQRLTGDIVQPFDDAGAEHSGRLHVVALGLARVVRRARLSGHEEVVRHERQQLRRRGRVRRRVRARAVTRGRRERQPGVAALQRPGEALRDWQPATGLLLRGRTEGAHRADVSPRTVITRCNGAVGQASRLSHGCKGAVGQASRLSHGCKGTKGARVQGTRTRRRHPTSELM